MTKFIIAAFATAIAVPAYADGQAAERRGDVAASTYLAEKPDSAERGERRQTARRVIIRDPNLRQVTPNGDPNYRNLATNRARR